MMERFLEHISLSAYRDKFILKPHRKKSTPKNSDKGLLRPKTV